MSVFIIAEAGVNHNGDEDRALAMVDAAHRAGADAIKFQTFSAEKVVSPHAEKAEYQKRETGSGNQYDMIKPLEMSEDLHRRLFDRCGELGIEFMSTPFDEEAAEFLISLGMKRLKVASGEMVNYPFLRFLVSRNLPLIISTGMATMEEVEETVAFVREVRAQSGITGPLEDSVTLLHCTSDYPAACSDVNLLAMTTIAERTGLPVGYSDHTLGIAVSTAAVARGATIIEKHFTLDRNLPGPDHTASLEPDELKAMVRQIRDVEVALGSPIKAPSEAEMKVRAVARRSIAAARPLSPSHVISAEDLILLRPGTGIPPKSLDEIVGRILTRPVSAGALIAWDDLV